MKAKRVTVQLNAIHLAYFITVLVIIWILNLCLLRHSICHKINISLKNNTVEINNTIDSQLFKIEQISSLFLSQKNLLTPPNINSVKLLNLTSLIDTIEIKTSDNGKAIPNDKGRWIVGINSDTVLAARYIRQIDRRHQLIIELKQQWLSDLLSRYFIYYPQKFLMFNNEYCITSSGSGLISYNQPSGNLASFMQQEDSTGSFIDKFYIGSHHHFMYAYALYNKRVKATLAFIHSRAHIYNYYLERYLASLTLIFVFVIILMANLIIRTNQKYTLPYKKVVQYLKNSKYLKINQKSDSNELMLIKRSFDLLHNQLDFYVNSLDKASTEKLKIAKDLELAKRLQKNILTKDIPDIKKRDDFEISAVSEAAYDIGGDLYDYFLLDDTHLLFVVGDVSGKGIHAALFMIYTQTLLRTIAKTSLSVSAIAEQLNNQLIAENVSDLFVTMLIGMLNTETGKLTYCNAAHNFPLIIRHEGIIEELSETHGIPLGIYPHRNYKSTEIMLSEGDQLMVYTDGVIDSQDENGMNYSVDVLRYNLMGTWFLTPHELVDKIKISVKNFRGVNTPVDDMTLLSLRFNHRGG